MIADIEKTTTIQQLNFSYKGKWREYQSEIFSDLEYSLSSSKINLITPMGANRFDIALEIIGHINCPALIITSSHSSRSIWRSRIYSHFLESQYRDSVSTNIRLPKAVTIITYQALINAFCGQASEYEPLRHQSGFTGTTKYRLDKANEIVKLLKNNKITTLCFDEPDISDTKRLDIITFLINNLSPLHQITVSENLPPVASSQEGTVYEKLFGKITKTITLDKLYKDNVFAPYRDFAYFSELTDKELGEISFQDKKIALFLPQITQNTSLINKLYSSSFMKHAEDNTKEIYKNLMFFTSLASLFKSKNFVIPDSFMDLLEAEDYDIPEFRAAEAQHFVSGLINNSEKFPELEEEITEIKNALLKYDLLQDYSLMFENSPKADKIITSSLGKLTSVREITNAEQVTLGENLKQLIITDNINNSGNYEKTTNILSVLKLMRENNYKFKSVVISEDLMLIPKDLEENFYDILRTKYISRDNITTTEFEKIEGYISVYSKDSIRNALIRSLLKMLDLGTINTIISTGNCFTEEHNLTNINTVIITSSRDKNSVKIRNQILNYSPESPERTVNIWHLCSAFEHNTDNIFIASLYQKRTKSLFKLSKMPDFESLKSRFEYISGLDINTNKISNTLSRIFPNNCSVNSPKDLLKLNSNYIKSAKDRKQTKSAWDNLISNKRNVSPSLTEGLETQHELPAYMYQTGYYYLFTLVFILSLTSVIIRPQLFIFSILFAFCFMVVPALAMISRATNLNMTKTVCKIILKTLYKQGKITVKPENIETNIINNFDGTKFIYTKSLNDKENQIYIKCLYEFFTPINNPTYLLVRRNSYLGLIEQKDYHALPEIFAENKKIILKFKSLWRHSLGNCKIYYTGVEDGNILLLRAHKRRLIEKRNPAPRIVNKWL
ncbi:hypothetical protein IKQ26_07445 [bacterium]|nr:hypothetical protein [bacterium]